METEFNIDPRLVDELAKSIKTEKDLAVQFLDTQIKSLRISAVSVVIYLFSGHPVFSGSSEL